MADTKESITVKQVSHGTNSYRYKVLNAVNTTEPKVGDQLTEEQVKELIKPWFKVAIK